jgi:hypothetical protein
MDSINDYNKIAISVVGFIIAVLGGFLISSGLINFYFFLGFETIVISLIAYLLAYPYFTSSMKFSLSGPFEIEKQRFKEFMRVFIYATWSLILGLILLATSFS